MPHTVETLAVFRNLREHADAEYDQAQNHNDPAATAIWARAHEKIRRLALLAMLLFCNDNLSIARVSAVIKKFPVNNATDVDEVHLPTVATVG